MSMKDNISVKLYNVIFPFWMLLLFPVFWVIICPANFIIDSLVLIISMYALGLMQKKEFYKKHILYIFGFGMLADIIGSVYMYAMLILFEDYEGFQIDGLGFTLPALLISAVLIFVFNYFVTFRKDDKNLRLKMSLIFAIITAPYTFLIPISWMY